MNRRSILVVDDRIQSLKGLLAILADEGYEVIPAGGGEDALAVFRERRDLDLVLADLKMPGMTGLDVYRRMNEIRPAPPFVIMTGFGTVRSAVEALKEGVTEYLIKPLDYEELLIVLEKAVREREMSRELDVLRREVQVEGMFHDMIGAGEKMLRIYDVVRTVGPTDASVLIRGETGTGKELLARSIHLESRRKDGPLVCINCAALTESLLEAELFGYVKGAFTGANLDHQGRLEAADGGTLFLDEIGHMSLSLQSKLLRFLQERTFEPVGSNKARKVDVRLITATNLRLQDAIKTGRFLPDLLYRIEVIAIEAPPLRERREDVPLLADYFVRLFSRQYGKKVDRVDPEAMKVLMEYDWPGNVREMKNCLARAVIMTRNDRIQPDDLPEKLGLAETPGVCAEPGRVIGPLPEKGFKLQEMEKELIRLTLEKSEGNKSAAAKKLGISRKALYQKMARLGIEPSGGGEE